MARAMACMQALVVISIVFLASISRLPMVVAAVADEAPSVGRGYRFELIHVDANGNFTREELMQCAKNRARLRVAMLSAEEDDGTPQALSGSFTIRRVESSPHNYLMELKMGSTEQGTPFLAVADTGSELVWTTNQKTMCTGSPSFSTTNSSCSGVCGTAKKHCNTCMFNKTFGGGQTGMTGFVGMETLVLPTSDDDKKKTKKEAIRVELACAIEWSDGMLPEAAQGIVGLSRGPMSLVKQLEVTKFSYCLRDPLEPTLRSPLWLGGDAQSASGGKDGWRTTPLVDISSTELSGYKDKYYVELEGICVQIGAGEEYQCNSSLKHEDFRFKSQDKGLMLVDSGTTYTHLDTNIFAELKRLLKLVVGIEVVRVEKLDCFEETPTSHPSMKLRFKGADMLLPWDSYVSKVKEGYCLAIEDANITILGSIQQHNLHMLYDLHKKELSFKRVHDCMHH